MLMLIIFCGNVDVLFPFLNLPPQIIRHLQHFGSTEAQEFPQTEAFADTDSYCMVSDLSRTYLSSTKFQPDILENRAEFPFEEKIYLLTMFCCEAVPPGHRLLQPTALGQAKNHGEEGLRALCCRILTVLIWRLK